MRRSAVLALIALLAAPALAVAEPVPAAVVSDPPPDAQRPPAQEPVAIPTAGVKILGLLLKAQGQGPHPAVLLLHGLPGFEENEDLAQAMRRDGWTVLTMHYRGAWGSPGAFSFTHCLEDAKAAVAWLRAPDGGVAAGVDPSKIVVIGHSMGAWVTAHTVFDDPSLLGGALISMGDLSAFSGSPRPGLVKALDDNIGFSLGLKPLAGTSAETLADEVIQKGPKWAMAASVKGLGRRPLFIATSDDGYAAQSEALAAAIASPEDGQVTKIHLPTDHAYSGMRVALEAAVLRWLENLPGAPAGL